MSVESKLNEILMIKTNIRNAIVGKGVAIASNLPFSAWPGKISEITSADVTQGQAKISFTATQYFLIEKMILPAGVTSIPAHSLRGMPMVEMVLPDGLVSIGDDGLAGCIFLEKINFPTSLKTIGNGFLTESAITSLVIPSSVTNIGTLSTMPNLKTLTINTNNLLTKGCYGSPKLESVILAPNIISINDSGFKNNPLLSSINLENIESISSYAFSNCPKLLAVNLTKAKTVDAYAFQGCSGLASIIIGPNLTVLNSRVFDNVAAKKLYFPKVKQIANLAITSCEALEVIEFAEADATLTFSQNAIHVVNSFKALIIRSKVVAYIPSNVSIIFGTPITNKTAKIYVPDDLVEAYKVANGWKLIDPSLIVPLSTYVEI